MQTLWWRRAIEQRLGTLTAVAIVLWAGATAIAASMATRDIEAAITAERRIRAQAIAARIESALEDELRRLDLVAAASAVNSPALTPRIRELRLADFVLRLDADGGVIWTRSVHDGAETTPLVSRLAPTPTAGRIVAMGETDTRLGSRVFLVMPARESDRTGGFVAAAISLLHSEIAATLASYSAEPYRVELTDEAGRPIAVSRPTPAPQEGTDTAMLTASAPLSGGSWRLRLSQPRRDALAPVLTLRRILVGSSLLLIPFAVLVAWAAAHSIRQPVLALTATAERLARGEFADAVPAAGEDEIGRLAEALEQLRAALLADERRSLLLKRVISAQEEERRRIARELHDQTTQQLSALAMQLESAAAALPDARAVVARSQALVTTMIDDVHRVIYDLRPSMLDDLGLLPAIRAYAERHLVALGIRVHCEFPPVIPPLAPEATTALYRVAQEAITNIARHARAETVLLGCTAGASQIVIEIEDDGVGFDPDLVARPRASGQGLGLLGMRERLALLGGRVDVESDRGHGTRVVIVLPINADVVERVA